MREYSKRIPSRRGKHKRSVYIGRYTFFSRKFQNEMRRAIAAAQALKEWEDGND